MLPLCVGFCSMVPSESRITFSPFALANGEWLYELKAQAGMIAQTSRAKLGGEFTIHHFSDEW